MDMSIQCLVYRTLPGSYLDHVGPCLAQLLIKTMKTSQIFWTESTWSVGHELMQTLMILNTLSLLATSFTQIFEDQSNISEVFKEKQTSENTKN